MKKLLGLFFGGLLLAAFAGSVFASGLPQANLTVSPAVGRVASEFTLDARQSRNSAGNLGGVEIRYKLSSGGNWSEWNRRTIQKFTPMDTGNMRMHLQVRDVKTGQVQTTYRSIKVLSSWLRRGWITVSDYTAEVGQPLDFELNLSLQSFDNPEDMEVRWDFDSDGDWDTSFSRQKQVSHVYDTARTVSPTAEVKFFDDEILKIKGIAPRRLCSHRCVVPTAFWKKLKIISPTVTAPIVDVRPGRVGFSEKTTFVFDASLARTPRGGWIEWSFDGQSWLRFPGKKMATHKFTSPGKHEVRTRVCIGQASPRCEETTTEVEVKMDATDYRVEILLQNKTNPSVIMTRNAQAYIAVEEGDRIRFSARLLKYSGKGQRFVYRWDFNNDGVWDTHFSTQNSSEHVYDNSGEFNVRVQVQNEDSVIADSVRRILVDTNKKPRAELACSVDQVYIGERVRFFPRFSGQANNGSRLQVRFDLDDDGLWESDFRGIGGQDWVYYSSGAVTVRMEIRDRGKNVTTVTKKIEVLPFPAVRARVIVSQREVTIGSAVSFDATGSEGRRLRYIWDFDSDGTETSRELWHGGSYSGKTSYSWKTSGEKMVSLLVIDAQGEGNQVFFPVNVLGGPVKGSLGMLRW